MKNKIIYYDGDCGLCHVLVRFILRIDIKNQFYFSPISNFQNKEKTNDLESIILSINGNLLYKSEAIINAFNIIGNGWSLVAQLLQIMPKDLADTTYDWVSKNRKKWTPNKKKHVLTCLPFIKKDLLLKNKIGSLVIMLDLLPYFIHLFQCRFTYVFAINR